MAHYMPTDVRSELVCPSSLIFPSGFSVHLIVQIKLVYCCSENEWTQSKICEQKKLQSTKGREEKTEDWWRCECALVPANEKESSRFSDGIHSFSSFAIQFCFVYFLICCREREKWRGKEEAREMNDERRTRLFIYLISPFVCFFSWMVSCCSRTTTTLYTAQRRGMQNDCDEKRKSSIRGFVRSRADNKTKIQ